MEMMPTDQEPVPAGKVDNGKGFLRILDKGVGLLSKVFFWIGGVGLVGMLLLIVADVIGIKIFSSPVPGGIETVAFLAVVAKGATVAVVAFALIHWLVDATARRHAAVLRTRVAVIAGLFVGLCVAVVIETVACLFGG